MLMVLELILCAVAAGFWVFRSEPVSRLSMQGPMQHKAVSLLFGRQGVWPRSLPDMWFRWRIEMNYYTYRNSFIARLWVTIANRETEEFYSSRFFNSYVASDKFLSYKFLMFLARETLINCFIIITSTIIIVTIVTIRFDDVFIVLDAY